MLAPAVETEIGSLSARYGRPRRVTAKLQGWQFSPLTMQDRYGEVCMVVQRQNGRLITAKKTFYPAGAFRLLTGGVDHGEPIAAALLREVAEETGLDVMVRRFLAVIEYQSQGIGDRGWGMGDGLTIPHPLSPIPHAFATFAFLLDEIGGRLQAHDPGEQIVAFRELEVAELPMLAATLENLPDQVDPEIDGSWRDWGRYRAVGHRVVYQALSALPSKQ
jgi:ADP-ribose pyrophosphatase YjhB (NUDIX family)